MASTLHMQRAVQMQAVVAVDRLADSDVLITAVVLKSTV